MYKWEYTLSFSAAGKSKAKNITCLDYSESIDSELSVSRKNTLKNIATEVQKNYSQFPSALKSENNVFRIDQKTGEKIDMGKVNGITTE